jgi:hypothetical protein
MYPWRDALGSPKTANAPIFNLLAGRVGFEPTWVFRPNSFSRRARSTAPSPPQVVGMLRGRIFVPLHQKGGQTPVSVTALLLCGDSGATRTPDLFLRREAL